MASVSTSDIPEEQQFFADYWTIRKRFYEPEDDENYWETVVDETVKLSEKYNRNVYFDNLLLVFVDDLEHRFRLSEGRKDTKIGSLEECYERLRKKRDGEANLS